MIRPRTITAANTSEKAMRLIRATAYANIQRETAEPSDAEVQKYKIPPEGRNVLKTASNAQRRQVMTCSRFTSVKSWAWSA